MSKNLELTIKVKGGTEDLNKLIASLNSTGASAGSSSTQVAALEAKIVGLEKSIKGVNPHLHEHKEHLGDIGAVLREHVITPFGTLSGTVDRFLDVMGKGPLIFAGFAGGLTLIGHHLFEMVEEAGHAAEEIHNMSIRLGLGVQETSKLGYMARIAGLNIQVLEGSTRILSAALADTEGQGKKASKALDKLGIDATNLTGEMADMGPIMVQVIEKLGGIENATERTRMATQLLGRGSKELQPLIVEYKEMKRAVEEMGFSLDENLVARLTGASHEINKMGIAWDIFKLKLAEKIEPIIIPIIGSVTQIIAASNSGAVGKVASLAGKVLLDRALHASPLMEALFGPGSTTYDTLDVDQARQGTSGAKSTGDSEIAQQKKTAENRARLFKALRASNGDPEELKKELEDARKDQKELVDALKKPLLAGAYAEKSAALKDSDRIVADLEARVKAAEKLKALLEKLKNAQGNQFSDNALISSLGLGALGKLLDERAADLKTGGPANAEKVFAFYAGKIQVELEKVHKRADEYKHKFIEAEQKSNEDFRKHLEQEDKKLEDRLKIQAEDLKQINEHVDATLKVDADQQVKKYQSLASLAEKQSELRNLNSDPRKQVEDSYQIQVSLANQTYDIEKKRLEAIRDTALEYKDWAAADLDLTKLKAKNDEDNDKARLDRQIKLIELQKKAVEDARGAAGSLFDAFTSKDHGQSALISFAKAQGKTVFENVAAPMVQRAQEALGTIGQNSGFGKYLKGTALDPSKAPIDKNTTALEASTKATTALVSTLTGGTGVGGVGAGGAGGVGGLNIPGLSDIPFKGAVEDAVAATFSITGTGKKPGGIGEFLKNFGGGAAGILGAGLFGGFRHGAGTNGDFTVGDEASGNVHAAGMTTTAARLGNIAASAGAVLAGTHEILNGIKQGGARGALGAAGGALGIAALIPGPQQPFLIAATAITGLIKGLLGDPKAQRERAITAELRDQTYHAPVGITLATDSHGKEIQTDFLGRTRSLQNAPSVDFYNQVYGYDPLHPGHLITAAQRQISYQDPLPNQQGGTVIHATVNVSTIDSKSFMDHSHSIGSALTKAIQDGHRVRYDISNAVKPR